MVGNGTSNSGGWLWEVTGRWRACGGELWWLQVRDGGGNERFFSKVADGGRSMVERGEVAVAWLCLFGGLWRLQEVIMEV